jgi:hypothetical protein
LGNFRSFSFPTPTFEIGGDDERSLAIQIARIVVPGFMALMMVRNIYTIFEYQF